MKILGYSVSKFVGKSDNLNHDSLSVVFGSEKNDDTHVGFYFCRAFNFIDKPKEFYQLITKYYKEGTDLDLLYNSYGKVQEIRPSEK